MRKNEVTFAGKSISVYNTRSYTPDDIGDFLKRFQLHETLRLIGRVSHTLFFGAHDLDQRIEGVPVSDAVLAYLSMRAIESANDYKKLQMTTSDLAKAADMYWGFQDPIADDRQTDACLIRFGSSQFDYQRRLDNLLARTLVLYRHLWDRVPGTVPISSVIENIAGVSVEEILMLTFAFTGRSLKQGGYFRLYTEIDSTDPEVIAWFQPERQQSFVSWLTSDYRTFRLNAREGLATIPSPAYEKYRFNPIVKYPIIKPDRNPLPGAPQVYIDPIPRLVHERVTRGLYFDLSDHFKGDGKSNPMRQSFGYVFQEYVGELLKDAFGESLVLGEFKYSASQDEKLTPDWIVIDGDDCLIVEVKQSGLFLEAKMWGQIETVKQDLSKSIAAGGKQLWNFDEAIRSGRYPELAVLSGIAQVERIIVTYDHVYFSNSIIRDRIHEQFSEHGAGIPSDYHWHVISIDELEGALGIHGSAFFGVLTEKRLDKEDDRMDFGDYLGRYFPERDPTNRYLERVKQAFFQRIGSELLADD